MKKILGLWSGHDASFCVLTNGVVELHTEAERHLRVKEPPYDSIKLFFEHHGDLSNVIGLSTCHLDKGIKEHTESWEKVKTIPLYVCGHHEAHASNAFYSSNFNSATVITVDGGGIEDASGFTTGVTIWKGVGTKLTALKYIPLSQMNIGGVWSRVTRCIFGYESGYPFGNQCGTTMALAALAKEPQKYVKDFRAFMTTDLAKATARAPGHIPGISAKDPREPRHPFLGKWRDIADADEQAKYDMAGALQIVTEEMILNIVSDAVELSKLPENICIAGGVALNSVAMGKISTLYNVYVPPVPYDAGLTIGSAQYAWHHVLGNERVVWNKNASPYLGKIYAKNDVLEALKNCPETVVENSDDNYVLELLAQGLIISVFNGRAESGRRALGNRSIIADPRNPSMKDMINEKVKHRQSFRPFAPSILYEHVRDWFKIYSDQESQYMNLVLPFRDEKKHLVPAVVHFDGTGRLQTVRQEDNPWYHRFITKWYEKTGVPILLNTSFNDREPIVEEPIHAINCFLKTKIDYLYFPEHNLLVKKHS